jgi:uncharacterized lipoprotein YddW (UPF0748 family)
MRMRRFACLSGAILAACASAPNPTPGIGAAIWVTRFDYRTAADIERIMDDVRNAGFSAVMFQVRGNGTVAWRSALEIFGEQFGFRDPGFDPLGVAVAAAHARGLELHAWINVMPAWRGATPPADPRQLYHQRPEWFLYDANGAREPLNRNYVSLNPCLPEVREYVAALCGEAAARYEIDGVHLDYIRFTDADQGNGPVYPLDARTRAAFRADAGAEPESAPEAFSRWKADQVTATVAAIRAALRATRPVALTAAVFADREVALRKVHQDWSAWAAQGLVDALLPMNYTEDDPTFDRRVADAVAASDVPVIVGIGAHRHHVPAQSLRQIDAAQAAGATGYCLFSYAKLFGQQGRADGWPAAIRAHRAQ